MIDNEDQSTDVIIVGAGIVGICCALSIIESGKSVRLIDRADPGQSTSFGNAGIISPWSIVPQSMPGLWKKIPAMLLKEDGPISISPSHLPKLIPWGLRFLKNGTTAKVKASSNAMELLNHSNVELYKKHLAGTGHEALVKDSWYVHAFRNANNAQINDLPYKIRGDKGADIERIEAPELRKLEPALSDKFKAAILIKGQARAISPGKIGKVLCKKAVSLGVLIDRSEVKALTQHSNNEWHVETSSGTQRAPKIVIAAGAWSANLLKSLGLKIPLQAERGYHVEFENAGIEIKHSIMDVDMMAVASSMENSLRVAGTAEFAHIDAPPNEKRVQELRQVALKMFPDLNTENLKSWMGTRPSFPDSLPMLGEFPNHKGLYSAFGHSHYGLMMAPKTGQIISDLINDKTPNIDLTSFGVSRFE